MMLNKKAQIVLTVVIIAALILGFIIFWSVSKNPVGTGASISENNDETIELGDGLEQKEYVIEITSSGFSPNNMTVNYGDTVTWINMDSQARWPASAMHPTHTRYAGANYDEEGSYAGSLACREEGVAKTGAFDPCKGIAPGDSWSFRFEQRGSWGYHDHLVNGQFGKVNVK